MANEVVFFEPGDERTQKIANAMGSQEASNILQFIYDGQKSLTDITDRLAILVTPTQYQVENLLDVGLISVSEINTSSRGAARLNSIRSPTSSSLSHPNGQMCDPCC